MAPSTPSVDAIIAKLGRLPKEKVGRAFVELSEEQRQAMVEKFREVYGSRSRLFASDALPGSLTHEHESLMLQYDEQTHYFLAPETEVDRHMKTSANKVPRQDIKPIEDCRRFAKAYSEQIFKLWQALETILIYHEETIRKRWMKKTRAQKQDILLAARPDMNVRHRPDFDYYSQNPWVTKRDFTEPLIFPYINLEDLLRPKALLIFLNSRGRHHLNNFAYSDLELAPMFKLRKEFLARREDNFTMSFIGKQSAHEYGAFVEWNDSSAMAESMKAGRTVHVDHGLQILTIQYGIWTFLFKCVGLVLRDLIEGEGGPSASWKAQPEPPQLTDNEASLSKLDIVAREAPYRLPSQLDLGRLQALASAQRSQAIDHAIALREDPGYFAETVEQYRNHRPELILDKLGNLHPHAKDFPLYNKALRLMAADAHCSVFVWHEIHNRMTKLLELSSKYTHDIAQEKDLPADFFELLTETRFFLEAISLDLIGTIKAQFDASPPLRAYCYRDNPDDANLRRFLVKRNPDIPLEDDVLVHVFHLIGIFEDKGLRDFVTLHALLDEFERLMQDEPHAKFLITAHLASGISQLSIMSECLHQLHQFQPWAQKIENTIENHRFDYMVRYDTLLVNWGEINLVHQKFEDPKLCRLGNPKDGKFNYPAEKRRTRDTVKEMIAAETALDAFWKAANANWLRHVGTTPTALVQHIIGERKLHRTPPWIEPSKGSMLENAQPKTEVIPNAFPAHSHDITKQITGSFNKHNVSSKSKKKTRGTANVKEEVPTLLAATSDVTSPPTLPVDKRALKVFNSLFHSPNSPNQPGEVAWHDFLHAMFSAGFAAEKLQGSAWHFTPKKLGAERSIQFHEPHPGNKLPFTWARRYGRRLGRAFGWSADSFRRA